MQDEALPPTSSNIARSFEEIDISMDVLKHVVSFVGDKQYRFVASINRRFKDAYVEAFPGTKRTAMNACTLKHAKICWNELVPGPGEARSMICDKQEKLCASAVFHGNLQALQYLRSVDCRWGRTVCAMT